MTQLAPSKRLVGKAYDGATKLAILHAKHLAGYTQGSLVDQAERLAFHGLRARLITELTGIPNNNTARMVKAAGNHKTGRRKTSIDAIFKSTYTQQMTSMFLCLVDRQRRLSPAPGLMSFHILDAIRTMSVRAPHQAQSADWEALTEAALQFEGGMLSLITCSACHTRHVIASPHEHGAGVRTAGTDRSCPLCRITESVTIVKRKVTENAPVIMEASLRRDENSVIPTLTSDLFERRARLRAAGVGQAKTAAAG